MEHMDAQRWWQALSDAGIDVETAAHTAYEVNERLPWDHLNIKYGRTFLEKEQSRSVLQLDAMANAI